MSPTLAGGFLTTEPPGKPCNLLTLPGGSEGKASAFNAGDLGSVLGQEDPLEKVTATHFRIFA